ncbi:Putative ribonuclease H protein At1g65750, partial [Linum perenne]
REIHNINWETVCKPKELGGLGLRSAGELNKAFLIELVWGLMKNPSSLWARVLISKYMARTSNGYALARKSGFSATWRGLIKVWPDVKNGLQWSIINGKNTKFWTDRWVENCIILADHALNIHELDPSLFICDVCLDNGCWNFDFLSTVLPH